jgi:hypothetical protein
MSIRTHAIQDVSGDPGAVTKDELASRAIEFDQAAFDAYHRRPRWRSPRWGSARWGSARRRAREEGPYDGRTTVAEVASLLVANAALAAVDALASGWVFRNDESAGRTGDLGQFLVVLPGLVALAASFAWCCQLYYLRRGVLCSLQLLLLVALAVWDYLGWGLLLWALTIPDMQNVSG